jgi:inner membrane protein
MFFLLLTSLSEHIGFARAYGVATLACVGLVTYYVVKVLGSIAAGTAFGTGLALLYGALFLLLRAEDYALIAGSLLVCAVLAGVMVGTRRVNWYQVASHEEKAVG